MAEEESKAEIKKQKIQDVEDKSKQVLDKLKQINYSELVSTCYTEMDSYIDMVVRGISTGCIIVGKAGTGKTYRALWRCKDVDYAYVDSFTTPASFYIFLWKNKDKDVIITDDIAGMMQNPKILAFLKGALWAVDKDKNGKPIRIVNYLTTKPLKDEFDDYVDSSFEMNARLIIITNQLNKDNEHQKAVLSRVHYCNVDIPRDELLTILAQIAQKDFNGITLEERKEVFEFLKENSSESTEELNIRTLLKMFQLRQESKEINQPELWKILSLKMLKKDDLLVLVEKLVRDIDMKEEDKVKKFIEVTGKSRATYFRLKKRLQ